MKKPLNQVLLGILLICQICTSAQAQDTTLKYGIWQHYGGVLSKAGHPVISGRLVNVDWNDIEPLNGQWVWDSLDIDIRTHTQDDLPIIFLIFVKEASPNWLFRKDEGGGNVSKVVERDENDDSTGFSPYYLDHDYNTYFKRMIERVRGHVDSMPSDIRKNIVGVQACLGSSGDYINYKGIVADKYAITVPQFDSLFRDYTLKFYNEYKQTNPKITLLSNIGNNGDDNIKWLLDSCPNTWIKAGSLGKGFQLNDENDKKTWLFDALNLLQNGSYVRSRCEINGIQTEGWWLKQPYKNMFALLSNAVYWGLDWSNQSVDFLNDPNSRYDSAYLYFNRYAGVKNAPLAANAMCALKDALDAADSIRFPVSSYGNYAQSDTNRYRNIANKYAVYGAKLEDIKNASSSESDNISAIGTNDVGWNIFKGNYERWLYQIDANATSRGYWNVNTSMEPYSMYGRFARGFDIDSGKNSLYFDVDSAFLKFAPLNSQYPVTINITYLDSGKGSFQLFYDGRSSTNKSKKKVVCTDTRKWKTVSILLTDAYFGNRGIRASDFYIKSVNSKNIIFSLIELTRSADDLSDIGLFASPLPSFDTICVNSINKKAFLLQGQFLNGEKITVGPLPNYSFSLTNTGTFDTSLNFINYGTAINDSIYVRFTTHDTGTYIGEIPINGGGVTAIKVIANARVVSSSPISRALISNISCYGVVDGAIDLSLTEGAGPFLYKWTSALSTFDPAFTQDLVKLKAADYSVEITSQGGCLSSNNFTVIEPDELKVTAQKDSAIYCKGGTTTVTVTATGGIIPYRGTGNFSQGSVAFTYTVTDANGCKTEKKVEKIINGTHEAPAKPTVIHAEDANGRGICESGSFNFSTDAVPTADTYTWSFPTGSSIVGENTSKAISLNMQGYSADKTISVKANNACGNSNVYDIIVKALPAKPTGIDGKDLVAINEDHLLYKVISPVTDLKYAWSIPNDASGNIIDSASKITVTWGSKASNVTVKANNKCGNSVGFSLSVNIRGSFAASINANERILSETVTNRSIVTLIPNPSKNQSVFLFKATAKCNYTIQVTDMTGLQVIKKQGICHIGLNSETINVQNLPNGIYIVYLMKNNGEKQMAKLIKQ